MKKALGLRLDAETYAQLVSLAEAAGASPTATATDLLTKAVTAASGSTAVTLADQVALVVQTLEEVNRKQDELLAAFAAPPRALSRGSGKTLEEFLDGNGADAADELEE